MIAQLVEKNKADQMKMGNRVPISIRDQVIDGRKQKRRRERKQYEQ